MNINQHAEAFALAYAATAEHTGEFVDKEHLKSAVIETIKAAVLDDRAVVPPLKVVIEEERFVISDMLMTEARRLKGLAGVAIDDSPVDYTLCVYAASILEKMEAAIRARSAVAG